MVRVSSINYKFGSHEASTALLLGIMCSGCTFAADINGPEEIIISGRPSLLDLRQERDQALKQVFTLFNQLNGDKNFNVNCFDEPHLGSRISKLVCTPEYQSKASADNAADFLSTATGGYSMGAEPVQAVIDRERGVMKEKIVELSRTSAEFGAALVKYQSLVEEYDKQISAGSGTREAEPEKKEAGSQGQ